MDKDDHLEGADFGDNEPDDEDDYGINKYITLGRLGKLGQQKMEETKIGLTEAGWLDNSPNGLNQNEVSIEPSILQNGSRWKTSVDQLKETKIYQVNHLKIYLILMNIMFNWLIDFICKNILKLD